MAVRAVGRLSDPRQFENIVLKNQAVAAGGAGLVLLKDVGRAEVGAENYDTSLKFSGGEAVGVGIQQLATANALDVANKCKASARRAQEVLPAGHGLPRRLRYHAGRLRLHPRGAR